MKKIFAFLLIVFLLTACHKTDDIQPAQNTTLQPPITSPTRTPTSTPTPVIVSAAENLVIHCGENLQLLGSLQQGFILTLFKANDLEYYSGSNFIKGTLAGDILVSSEIKGTNLRLQNNTLTKTSVCFVGFQNGDKYLGMMLPVAQLLNERKVTEQFEGSFLIQANGAEFGLEWLTYPFTTSSKKSCLLYRIIKNPYPCSQDCATLETEPGCECFCANFLYYDENCIATEINPNCMCVCHGEESNFSPTLGD
ncbi:MAG: hypothetical protein AB2L18_02810 [Anaerolineaceae bacterium]